jgi:ABC-2 type transport system ATP-binding protein
MSPDKAIILSTHILDEVEAVCSRAIIIADGRIVADDTPENLKAQSSVHGTLSITLLDAEPQTLLSCIQNIDGVKSTDIIESQQDRLNVRIYPESTHPLIADKIIATLRDNQYNVASVFVEQGRLNDVFRTITMKNT